MPRTLVFFGRRPAFELQQRRIEPLALGDEPLMLFLEPQQTRSHPLEFGTGTDDALRYVAPGAFELDFRTATCTFVFQLHLIVPDHAFDQLVPCQHPFPSTLEFGGFLRSHLWPTSAGIHDDGLR